METKQPAEFSIGEMLGVGIILIVFGIGISYGLQVMGEVKGDFIENTSEYNASISSIKGVAKLPEKLPLIATVIIAVIIIGLLMRYLMGVQR